MPTFDELLRELADRGHPRGAAEVFSTASAHNRAFARPALVAAAIIVVVLLTAGIVTAGGGPGPFGGPERAEIADRPTTSTSTTVVPEAQEPDAGAGVAPAGPVVPSADGPATPTRLDSHGSCSSLLGRLRELGASAVGPEGFRGQVGAAAGSGGPAGGESAPGSSDAPTHSRSNVQEPGVDEADLLKTDGELLVAVARQRLQVVSVADRSLLATVDLGMEPTSLFLAGRTAVVLGAPVPDPERRTGVESVVVVVDLTDPAEPALSSSHWIEGVVTSSRLQRGVVRLVVNDSPEFVWTYPADGSDEARAHAEAENRRVVESSPLEAWLPQYRTLDATGRVTAAGSAAACTSTYTPSEQSGFATTTVLTLDPASGALHPGTGVAATPLVVYASESSLYVVSMVCCPAAPDSTRSDVHRFDLQDPSGAPYRSSGSVAGIPVDQFALSESDGRLRIATTSFAPDGDTDSAIWVLEEAAGSLGVVGSVTGLGEAGETIHSVRYHDGFAYVVTFRRTDPLYVVDLRRPTDPRVLGELHVPGFSTFLQHLGDGRLMGVGRAADETSGQAQGLQLSLFDIADPATPSRTDVLTYEHGSSRAEWDHLAFLHWPPTDLVVVPLHEARDGDPCRPVSGALLLRVEGGAIREIGRASHAGHAGTDGSTPATPSIHRSAMVRDSLVTLSELGVAFGDPASGAERGFVAFEGPAPPAYATGCAPPPGEPVPDDSDAGVL